MEQYVEGMEVATIAFRTADDLLEELELSIMESSIRDQIQNGFNTSRDFLATVLNKFNAINEYADDESSSVVTPAVDETNWITSSRLDKIGILSLWIFFFLFAIVVISAMVASYFSNGMLYGEIFQKYIDGEVASYTEDISMELRSAIRTYLSNV